MSGAKQMQDALRAILAIAQSVKPGEDRGDLFYKIGRIIGEARAAVTGCANRLDSGQPCGDEGRMCEKCEAEAMAEHSWMRGRSQGTCTGVMSEQDKQDLRDAGRGHLVRS